MSNQNFSFYKIKSNNSNLDYPNILTKRIDYFFPKLYFSPLIWTKIECINKQLLVNVNQPNKAIWKPALNKATKDALLFEKICIKEHGKVYEVVTYKIFVRLNSFRKYKILISFTLANWDTMGLFIT